MTFAIRHKKTSALPDTADETLIQASDWNDDHEIVGTLPAGAGVTVVQASGVLAQGEVLTVSHAADIERRRLVSLVRRVVVPASVGGRLNPVMTSNTAPAGIASASNIWGAGNEAFRAFDGIDGTNNNSWATQYGAGGSGAWLRYDFVSDVAVAGARVSGIASWGGVLGANNGRLRVEYINGAGSWAVAKTFDVNDFSGAVVQTKSYLFDNTITARCWRVVVDMNSSNFAQIGEIEFMGVGAAESVRYSPAALSDYDVLYLDDATTISRTAAGSEQLTASVWLP